MPSESSPDAAAAREARWRRIWQSRRWPAWAWWPLAQLHGGLVRLRRLGYRANLFRSTNVGCPILVVGNVIAGGAGKTPTTIALVQHLQARGLRVGVVSRGHGRSGHAEACLAVTAQATADEVGDEPLLIHLRTGAPVFVARQRARAAQALLQAHPETQLLICDDGLQHLALARDLSLCVFDERGLGNGWLLPAGPLREPWPVAVDWCVQIREAGEANQIVQAVPGAFAATRQLADHAVDGHGRRVPLAALRERTVVAFAGIAKPEVFFAAVRAQGLAPAREIALGDHADPLDNPALKTLLHQTTGDAALLCTEKDAVKLWPRFPQVLAVPLRLALPATLLDAVDARVDALLAETRAGGAPGR